ncbi:hypothetical protein [Bacillus tuaregi]|uniref:hypothetical protein n=1 Tax=Bacillus tuaregi TaxID=1816695 RepID=UPI0008F809BB|nr:hypothetical protein [Bacillus tuaregi]
MTQEDQKPSDPVEHMDPLTRFMLGGRRNNYNPHDGDNEPKGHSAGRSLFNNQNNDETIGDKGQTKSTDNQLQDLLANVNVEELMKNIDMIKSSASQFKPLVSKLGPIINKWIK